MFEFNGSSNNGVGLFFDLKKRGFDKHNLYGVDISLYGKPTDVRIKHITKKNSDKSGVISLEDLTDSKIHLKFLDQYSSMFNLNCDKSEEGEKTLTQTLVLPSSEKMFKITLIKRESRFSSIFPTPIELSVDKNDKGLISIIENEKGENLRFTDKGILYIKEGLSQIYIREGLSQIKDLNNITKTIIAYYSKK